MPSMDQLTSQILGNTPGARNNNSSSKDKPAASSNVTTRDGTGADFTPTEQGYTDVMNREKIPNVQNPEGTEHYFNIDDPNVPDWQKNGISLDIPPYKPEIEDPCMSNCQVQAIKRQQNCAIFRKRVEAAMARAGCPSVIGPRPFNNSCNAGCGAYPAYSSNVYSAPTAPAVRK